MEYIKCKSCGIPIASFNEFSKSQNIHIQCKSCKAYNVINENKVVDMYLKLGRKPKGE